MKPYQKSNLEEICMIARVATFENVNVQDAAQKMNEAESIIRPITENMSGYEGHLELLSPEGRGMSITLFDSMESAAAAEPVFDETIPASLGDLFKEWEGRRLSVDYCSVLTMESELASFRGVA